MMPSSSQWTMPPEAEILVYPMSSYVIDQTVKQSRSAERQHHRSRSDQQTATVAHRNHRKTAAARGYHVENGRGRSEVRTHRLATDPFPAETAAPRSLSRSSRRSDSRRRRRSVSNSSDGHSLHRPRRRRRRCRRRRRGRPAASLSVHPQSPDQLSDRDIDHHQHEADEADARAVRRSRRSANVVLLAHGNRSLYVLAIQRTRNSVMHYGADTITSARRQRRGTLYAPIKYNYKLPGGKLIILNGKEDDYDQQDRNTCSCSDDQRWYTSAIEHLETLIEIMVPLSWADDGSDIIHGHQGAPLLPLFMPLGKWYRTQDKEVRREELSSDATSSVATYYPYKPAHVSGHAAEQKRIYAVPDALRLFRGQQLRLHVPRAKVRTVTSLGSTNVTTITTYKCKFVPIARLHENDRLYGPILSSLPTVLSSLDLIYMP